MTTFRTYTIEKGYQYMKGRFPKLFVGKSMRRIVRFNSSAIHTTIDPVNQWDCSKAFGFTDGFLTKYDGVKKKYRWANSARFGWAYLEGALRLFAYVYVNGERIVKELGAILLDKDYELTILAIERDYHFFIKPLNPEEDELLAIVDRVPRGARSKTVWGWHLFFFFGGDEVCDHDITIQMKKI